MNALLLYARWIAIGHYRPISLFPRRREPSAPEAHSRSSRSTRFATFQTGTKEWVECSYKGLCDRSTGTCDCFPGYGSSDGQNNKGALGDCGWVVVSLFFSSVPGYAQGSFVIPWREARLQWLYTAFPRGLLHAPKKSGTWYVRGQCSRFS